jgi:hypothetical protein
LGALWADLGALRDREPFWKSVAATRALQFGFAPILLEDTFETETDGLLPDDATLAATVLNVRVCKVTT